MWVRSEFFGDADDKLMWLQHDCYWSTLSLINTKILEATGITLPPDIDHRDFQRAHDLLAACFRYEFKENIGYKKLSVDNILGKTIETIQPRHDQEVVWAWLNWLERTLLITEIENAYKLALQSYEFQKYSVEIRTLEKVITNNFDNIQWLDIDQPSLIEPKRVSTTKCNGVKTKKVTSAREKAKAELAILKKQKQIIAKSISELKKIGVKDQYFPTMEITWAAGAFEVTKSGWSKVTKFEYDDRKEQLLPKLPEGGGCIYVLGINGRPELCKIGFTTLSAHERASHYGRKYDLDLFVCEIHDTPDARALERIMHSEFSDHQYIVGNAKEVFSVTPAYASEKLREYLPTVSNEARQRELQWLILEKLLTDSKILKLSYNAD